MDTLVTPALVLLDALYVHEYIAIGMFPAGVAVLFTPIINKNVPRVALIGRPVLGSTKLRLACALLAAQVVNFVVWNKRNMFAVFPAKFATIVSVITSLFVILFMHSRRQFVFPSSTFHSIFLATTVVYDVAMARHSMKVHGSIGIFQSAVIALKFLYVYLNLAYKNRVVVLEAAYPEEKESVASSLSSIWSCLSWPGLISVGGLEQNFKIDDLPEPEWELCSMKLFRKFQLHWDGTDKESSQALPKAITSTMGEMFRYIIPLRLLHVACTLAQPILFWHILTTLSYDNIPPGAMGLNLVLAAIIWTGLPVLKLAFTRKSDRIVVSTRAILLAAIYDKTMTVSAMHIHNSNVLWNLVGGIESGTGSGMSSIRLLIDSAQDVVFAVIQIWLGVCLLWPFIGCASLLIFVSTTMIAFVTYHSGRQELYRRTLVNQRREACVGLTFNILDQLRNIKMMGLGPLLATYLKRQRKAEIEALLFERHSRMREFSLLALNHSITPVLVIAGYLYLTQSSHSFGAAETFTCFLLVRIVANAFNIAVDGFSRGQEGREILACIQKFLLLEDATDRRMLAAPSVDALVATPTVHLVRATVMSDVGEVIILEATLRAFKYGLTMVFGPTASGKSTLMRLILGEVSPSAGRVMVSDDPMTYCGEEPWLPFAPIRAIIVGNATFDAEWYAILTHALQLDRDFARLPRGDMTCVGEADCKFSVDMKQRISMARAFYERPSTIVLDDPLSAVNLTMAMEIFECLFGPRGLAFRWECTVIMATNVLAFLRFADAIFTIGQDGRVKNEDVSAFNKKQNILRILHNSNGLFVNALDDDGKLLEPTTDFHPAEDGQQEEEQDAVEMQGKETHRHIQDFSLYSYFQQPAGNSLVWSWPAVVCVAATMAKIPETFWGFSLSDDAPSPASVAWYAIFGVANVVCSRVAAQLYYKHVSTKISETLHWRMIKTVVTAVPEFARNANTLPMLKLFDGDLEIISRGLPNTFIQCFFMLVSVAMDAAIISLCAKYTVTVVIALTLVLRRIYHLYLPFAKRLRSLEASTLGTVSARYHETAAGVEHIRTFRLQKVFYLDFHKTLTRSQKPHYYVFDAKQRMEYTLGLFTSMVALVTIGLVHKYPQSSSPARLGLALVSIVDFTETLKLLASVWVVLEEYLEAVFRIRKFCDETPVEVEEQNEFVPAQWPTMGNFEFFGVVPENCTVDESSGSGPVLDLALEGSQKIVVNSRQGSNQSCVILAVLRMINYSGAIRLDDMNIKNVPHEVLRSRITTITRKGLELDGTLRTNLDPCSLIKQHFSDAELISMLHRVRLWDTAQRSGGLDANMKRMRFSIGQKQLLNLARGALHRIRENTKVVLIDHAITHLDSKTNAKMQDFINGEFATCTILMVSYDLRAARTADTLLTVERGAITGVLER